jgi:hypothetical protein
VDKAWLARGDSTEPAHTATRLAHGVPGVITLLGQVCAGIAAKGGAADRAARWLLATTAGRLRLGVTSHPPTRLAGARPDNRRCSGPPGCGRANWGEALAIARRAAEQPAGRPACRCRPVPRLAGPLFNRLIQATGEHASPTPHGLVRAPWRRQPDRALPAMPPDAGLPAARGWIMIGLLTGAVSPWRC